MFFLDRRLCWIRIFIFSRQNMKRIVTILGATGTGKSDLAVYLAKKFNGEVINADVMQIYKGLPILRAYF